MGGADSKEFWARDEDFPNCEDCKSPFTLTNRRHHCRCCGKIFCSECTSSRGCPINPQTKKPATRDPVRLCAKCATAAISKTICQCRPERLAALKDLQQQQQNGGGDHNNNNSKMMNGGNGGTNTNNNSRRVSEMDGGKQNLSRHGDSALVSGNDGENYNANQNGHDYQNDNDNNNNNDEDYVNPQEVAIKARIDQITNELNNDIVNLAPLTSDYGLHFSENPVYGMRIATVLGPVPFSLPTSAVFMNSNSSSSSSGATGGSGGVPATGSGGAGAGGSSDAAGGVSASAGGSGSNADGTNSGSGGGGVVVGNENGGGNGEGSAAVAPLLCGDVADIHPSLTALCQASIKSYAYVPTVKV